METQLTPIFAPVFFDSVIHDTSEFSKFTQKELPSAVALASFAAEYTSAKDTVVIGKERFHVCKYAKIYTGEQQVSGFFKALFITTITLGFGLLNQKVRHNWDAALFGQVVKQIAVSEKITMSSLGQHAFKVITSNPGDAVSAVMKFADNYFSNTQKQNEVIINNLFRDYSRRL
jgi:hypothetical protein